MLLRSRPLAPTSTPNRPLTAALRAAMLWFWRFSQFYGQYSTTPVQARRRFVERYAAEGDRH